MPPTGNMNFNGGCPAGLVGCTDRGGGALTLDPALSLTPGTMVLPGHEGRCRDQCHLKPGVYIVNSLSFNGGATLTLDIDPAVVPAQQVIFQVAGQNTNTPIDFTGGTIANETYDPSRFQIFYAGNKNVKLTGGAVVGGAGLCTECKHLIRRWWQLLRSRRLRQDHRHGRREHPLRPESGQGGADSWKSHARFVYVEQFLRLIGQQ